MNKNSNTMYGVIKIGIVVAFAGLLSACGGYNLRVLKPLNKDSAHYKGKSDGVKVYVARLDKKEVKDVLGRSVRPDQVVALQLTVKNTSPFSISFSKKHVSLPILTPEEVIRVTERSVMGPFLVGLGAAMVADAATAGTHDKAARVAGKVVSGTALVGGTAAAISNANENDDFVVDLSGKLFNEETLWPGEEVSRLFFVAKKAYRTPFTIRISQLVENAKGRVVEKHVLPFKVNFFSDGID